jgi:oxygen-independent coproporphyrinogen-3 oxidase
VNSTIQASTRPTRTPVRSLYVHVPFCAHKCEYCAFYSEATNGRIIERYVGALLRELAIVAPELRPETVFFGGGTPSILTLKQWERLLETMHDLGLAGAAEWTVECNPATVSPDKARLLREGGVNRISMGVQSLDEGLLERLGRVHSREMVFRSFETLRGAGFDNVNLDLMFAIPGQTLDLWRATLDQAVGLGSEHLSCYEVIYEEDTPLFEQLQAGKVDVDEELACRMYDMLVDRAAAAGFRQYEIANFARPHGEGVGEDPARACRHNINYWRSGEYHGLGPSATGYVGGRRTKNWSNTPLYCEQLEKGRRAIESVDELDPLARAGETAAFGLRMNRGWRFAEFQSITGYELQTEWRNELGTLRARGWGEEQPDGFRLTREGLRFADAAGGEFLRS